MKKTIPLGSRKAGALVSVLTLGLASVSLASRDMWIAKSPMPTERSCLSTSVVDGKIYAIGGVANANSAALSIVEEYDSKTDIWSTRTNMPTARLSPGACAAEGKIYVIGGGQRVLGAGSSTVQQYDPETDTWMRKANMPTSRFVLSASVVNGKIYAIGGKPAHGAAPLRTVEEYDPATDTWMRKAPMSTARFGLSTCAVDGKIYAIGGDPGSYVGLPTVEEYDPTTDTWTKKADMPTAREFLSASVLDELIYVIGGVSTLYGAGLSIVDEYDPATDTWTRKSDMPTPRFILSSIAVNSQIYVMGGAVKPWPSWQGCSIVEQYDPNPFVVDLNADGIVDCADLSIIVDHWGTDEPSCDIAPRPFGDGIVDTQDLAMLSEHLFEEILPPGLVAYWKLDEIEGIVAYDSTGQNDATLIGGPAWQPDAGRVGGALALDGIDDSVFAQFALNPSDGPFSVFAWVEGGVPGQTIISQLDGADWVRADPSDGALMTALTGSGRSGGPLLSQTVITDGDWHRIGLVWDGLNRTLYVDDVPVAQDTQTGSSNSVGGLNIGSVGGLNIGCGTSFEPYSFFSGLIDDVRIYSRAVRP